LQGLWPEFARLLTATHRRLYAFILALAANPADADDIMQETRGVLWRKLNDFEPGTDFASWAMAVARHVVMQQ
jgi:DNA-directed RNA polymerase specialized sigma24 family protein